MQIAALYVAKNGPYFGLNGVDPWDEDRDARTYTGPHPVVAHPPCQRWGKFAAGSPLNISRGIVETPGDDGGCFANALRAVRHYGGVIEHPENSRAWETFGLAKPPRKGRIRQAGPATHSQPGTSSCPIGAPRLTRRAAEPGSPRHRCASAVRRAAHR